MPSIISGFEYDIFVSYRQNDNKRDGWVTEFVKALQDELDATVKEKVSIYFDENPHDGLHESHDVDDSLREKVKCLVFIPIVSQTYCDPNSFAWKYEFLAFLSQASQDQFGLKTKLSGGNVASRVLPVKIHDIEKEDQQLFESEVGGVMRSIDFIYKEVGVNRPLSLADDRRDNLENTDYRNQVNKVANAVKEIINSLSSFSADTDTQEETTSTTSTVGEIKPKKQKKRMRGISQPAIFYRKYRSHVLMALIFTLLGALINNLIGIKSQTDLVKSQLVKFSIPTVVDRLGRQAVIISSDGQNICYINNDRLFLKATNSTDSASIIKGTGPEIRSPFFSPDGTWIGYEDLREEAIYRIRISGGTPQMICDLDGQLFGANWYEDEIIFSDGSAIFRVTPTGGIPEKLYPLSDPDPTLGIRNPQLSPDKEAILFTRSPSLTGLAGPETRLLELGRDTTYLISKRTGDARFLSANQIAFLEDGQLYIQEFDASAHELVGPIKTIPSPSIAAVNPTAGQFAFSQNGWLVYYTTNQEFQTGNRQLAWVDFGGGVSQISRGEPQFYYSKKIAPDGKQIITTIRNQGFGLQLGIVNEQMGTLSFISEANLGEPHTPVWHPNNKSINFVAGNSRIFEKPLDLSYEPRVLYELEGLTNLGNWSKDGRHLVFSSVSKSTENDIGYINAQDSTLHWLRFINTPGDEILPALSPDGNWLAFTSNKDGSHILYVVPFPGPGPQTRISLNEGYSPVWAPDMKALYFVDGGTTESWVWEVDIKTEPQFSNGRPKRLFQGSFVRDYSTQTQYGLFDIHPEEDKFLMHYYPDSPGGLLGEIHVVVNWQESISN